MKKLIVLISLVFNTACDNSSSRSLYSPPKKAPAPLVYNRTTIDAGSIEVEITPKAEILFVIDNSKSMEKHLQNVSASIDKFVAAFTKNNPIEYNISVISVYDHRTYETPEYKERFKDQEHFAMGQARARLSYQDDDLNNQLKSALKIGVQTLKEGGPEREESFLPALTFFKNLKPDPKTYKVIFFVTDANDKSNISADQLYYELVAMSDGDSDRVMAFGAIVPSTSRNCTPDPGGSSENIERFLNLANKSDTQANMVSLCKNFGQNFAQFGKSIKEHTRETIIPLGDQIPVITDKPEKNLHLSYGDQKIWMEMRPDIIGFTYKPATNSIHLNPELELTHIPGEKLLIHYNPLHPVNIETGHIKRYGE